MNENDNMSSDRCANRQHSLSVPPRVRRDRRVPREGCKPCVSQATGSCPYRSAYRCSDEDMEIGRIALFCVKEWTVREKKGEEIRELLAYLPEDVREEAELRLELHLDAQLFLHRAFAWLTLLQSDTRTSMASTEFRMAVRYYVGAQNRAFRRLIDLKPFLAEATHLRKEERWYESMKEKYGVDPRDLPPDPPLRRGIPEALLRRVG